MLYGLSRLQRKRIVIIITPCLAIASTYTHYSGVARSEHSSRRWWGWWLFPWGANCHWRGRIQVSFKMLFRCDLPRSVGQSVSEWVMFSDFRDSYRIYRACELVKLRLWMVMLVGFCSIIFRPTFFSITSILPSSFCYSPNIGLHSTIAMPYIQHYGTKEQKVSKHCMRCMSFTV